MRFRRFTIWHAALLLPWVVAAAALKRTFNDNSYLWHVRAGDLQIELGAVLTTDPFSFTMQGRPWRTQSWLADLVYSPLDVWLGLDGALLLTAVLSALTFLLLGLVAYRNTRSVPSVVIYLVASAVVLAAFLNPRPVIFSFPLMAAVVLADDDRRLRWALPLLMWMWASVHGSFAIGLAYLGLRALGRRGPLPSRFLGVVAAGVPTLLTAHGWGVVSVLLDFFGNRAALDYLTEWATPDLLSVPMLPVLAGIFGLVAMASTGRLDRSDWWLIVPFLALAVSANRSVPLAWIALSSVLTRVPVPGVQRLEGLGGPVGVVVAVFLLVFPFFLPSQAGLDQGRFPVEAAKHLGTDRVFHDDGSGGWLIYRYWPERLVYIDDRAELFGDRVGLFIEIRGAERDWRSEFDEYGIEEALLHEDDPLRRLLEAEGWSRTYQDEDFLILAR